MIVDQFRDYSDSSADIEGLKLRARLFETGAARATNETLAAKLASRAKKFAHRARVLENNAMRWAQ